MSVFTSPASMRIMELFGVVRCSAKGLNGGGEIGVRLPHPQRLRLQCFLKAFSDVLGFKNVLQVNVKIIAGSPRKPAEGWGNRSTISPPLNNSCSVCLNALSTQNYWKLDSDWLEKLLQCSCRGGCGVRFPHPQVVCFEDVSRVVATTFYVVVVTSFSIRRRRYVILATSSTPLRRFRCVVMPTSSLSRRRRPVVAAHSRSSIVATSSRRYR